ncbi:hypothetical protein [Legionella quateirensis]|uniref:Uncharacterized protein n=1 Tax=Legionella quateirensis TaxID=45072 RepID=A0A378KZQ6_9GAMM|nr:hypothetical protein [Legionella quateirensis]KTD52674.1 hypothetical protein Lqua_0507 [Legionella quateirensis]STY19091.1 Uncharacterised protein [Legionella quateirensis]
MVDAWKGSHSHYDWEQVSEEKKPEKNTIYIHVKDNAHLKYSVLIADGNLAEGIIELNEVLSQIENEMVLDVKKIEQIISSNGHRSYFYPASLFKKTTERNNTSQIKRVVNVINPSVDVWSDSWQRWDMLPAADIKMLGEDGEFILRAEIETGLREHRNKMTGFFKSLNEKSSQQEYPDNLVSPNPV